MAREALTLDGLALNDGTSFKLHEVDLTPPPKRLRFADNADSDGSALVEEAHFENRIIELRLRVITQATMDAALDKIGLLVNKLQEAEQQADGLAMTWTPTDSARTITFYVLAGEITGLPLALDGSDIGWFKRSPVITVRLTCKPFGYGPEVSTTAVTNTDPIQLVTVSGVTGDVPAEGRLVVTDNATQNRSHVEWGLEWRHQAGADLLLSNTELTATGFAGAAVFRAGSYSGNQAGNPSFTNDTSGYQATATTGETIARVTDAAAFAGTTVLEVVTNGSVASEGVTGTPTSDLWPSTATPGETWTVSVYAKGVAGGEQVRVVLMGRDASGTLTESSTGTTTALTTGWQRLSITRTLNVATTTRVMLAVTTPTASAVTFRLDAVQVERGAAASAYDPLNVYRATLTSSASVAVVGTGDQPHVGTFRVKARVYASADGVSARLAWRSGDSPHTRNAYAQPALSGQWMEIDLGLIQITPAKSGTQRWEGRIEAKATTPGTTLDVDYLVLVPASRYGVARVPQTPLVASSFAARDEFDGGAAALTGRVAPVGGTWTVVAGSDADDFNVSGSGTVTRTAVSDANVNTGRYVSAGTSNHASVEAVCDSRASSAAGGTGLRMGIFVRLVDVNNWIMLVRETDGNARLRLHKRVAGVVTQIMDLGGVGSPVYSGFNEDQDVTLKLVVDSRGAWEAYAVPAGSSFGQPIRSGTDADFMAGAALGSGRVGIYDSLTDSSALTRTYDNFLAFAADPDYAIHSSQSLEVRHNDTIRENAAGTIWGRPPSYRGSRFYLQPAGDENRSNRVLVKARRLDVTDLPDSNIADSTTAQVFYRPRFLAIPR